MILIFLLKILINLRGSIFAQGFFAHHYISYRSGANGVSHKRKCQQGYGFIQQHKGETWRRIWWS